jgi:hypothetical protein
VKIIFNLLLCLSALLLSIDTRAATGCDEWADFTKIITFRFRDTGMPKDKVKTELMRVKGGDPEMDIALGLIDYSYAHPKDDAVKIWHGAYEKCLKKNSI